ncbi:hypothetical protein AMATHDRAFT_145231 [Amanita thiersii Skay4041]|uniref:Non-specific serine/threonine protein kinase n=1 Tax=Amanita thiersii Skay4041 TaxID=703135 RepID=A0A2A9NID2_9AGAR|nr:hypothetical protein AMATHDRAFT_145231 [Amanita thiersii Skay4041]
MSTSANLQIPPDASAGPSRHHHQSSTSSNRPVSVAVQPTPASTSSSHHASSRRHQRASHTPVSSHHPHGHVEEPPAHIDVYAHPAAQAYAAAHPRRQIPKFGPYLLLQTLGEGEFGKVKLGLHTVWGEEVAVKLIRRGNVDSPVRMSKIEREIEVLRILKHPNIVRLYDVIETDKYIGIILEYASGGELFDHILAHRYLRERDAAKLFSQLISGVWYIHQKKIVHRDLKLENLLLDRNRNVIITDFGFANRFEHRADDLMQTSCGSPCYAAPELVISEGLYVGSAVDIWSCGVILYAMLAGYLPFDDDPANPDGDNINLLYKYIVSTPLSFPDYISTEARDLLGIMLVPDPSRRASIELIMKHPWLGTYAGSENKSSTPNAFGKTVDDLERAAMEQHQQKRLAYQRQVKALVQQQNAPASSPDPRVNRSVSYRPAEPQQGVNIASGRSKSTQPAQSDYIYQSSADQSAVTSSVAITENARRAQSPPAAAIGVSDDDPFAGPSSTKPRSGKAPEDGTSRSTLTVQQPSKGQHQKAATSPGDHSPFRHTIQVEYDSPATAPKSGRKSEDKERKTRERNADQNVEKTNGVQSPRLPAEQPPATPKEKHRPSHGAGSKPLPTPPPPASTAPSSFRSPSSEPGSANVTPTKRGATSEAIPQVPKIPIVNVASPPDTPAKLSTPAREASDESNSQASVSSKKGHKKGASIDKLGLAKIFGGGSNGEAQSHPERVPSESSHNSASGRGGGGPPSATSSVMLSPAGSEKEKEGGRKSRRNTLTVMVEPLISRTIRSRGGKSKTAATPVTTDGASAASGSSFVSQDKAPKSAAIAALRSSQPGTTETVDSPFTANPELGGSIERVTSGMQASTNKARKVMHWFRTKSKGVGPEMEEDKAANQTQVSISSTLGGVSSSAVSATPPVQVFVTTPTPTPSTPRTPLPPKAMHPQRAASTATETPHSTPSFVKRFRNSVTVGGSPSGGPGGTPKRAVMRIHHGAVDQAMVTTRPPPEVMKQVREVLEGMGLEIQVETEYKYKCIRTKKRKGTVGGGMGSMVGLGVSGPSGAGGAGAGGAGGLAAVTMVGSAASNGVDKRGLPLPSQSTFSATGGMLRGLLMRRQSSQVSSSTLPPTPVASGPNQSIVSYEEEHSSPVVVSEPVTISETAYGDPSEDAGDEVRFSVELTRIDRLNDTYSLDVRRLKGTLRSYKYLYDTLRQ